jgi:hypothetical protein
MYKVTTHELGHNLSGRHSRAINCNSSGSVMCSSVQPGTPYFSSANLSAMNSYIADTAKLIEYLYYNDDCICSNETFSVSNIPYGFSVSWPKSSNLAFNGNSTGSPVTIKPFSSGSIGEGWVMPTLTRSNSSVSFPKDEFWVGKPQVYTLGNNLVDLIGIRKLILPGADTIPPYPHKAA